MSKATLQDLTSEVELYDLIGHDPAYDNEDDNEDDDHSVTEYEIIENEDEEVIDYRPIPGILRAVIIPTAQSSDNEEQEASSTESEVENEQQDGEEADAGKCNYLFI
jgi:hypothetical protein